MHTSGGTGGGDHPPHHIITSHHRRGGGGRGERREEGEGGRGLCRLGKRGDCGRISFTHSRTGGGVGGKTGTRSCCAAIQNQRRGGRSKGRGAHHRKGGEGLVLCRRGTRSNTGRIGQRGGRDTARTQAWPLHRHPRHRVPSYVRVGEGGGGEGILADCT